MKRASKYSQSESYSRYMQLEYGSTMKQYIHRMKYLVPTILLWSCISCSDFLFQEPTQLRSINEQFSTKENVEQAINGVYVQLEDLVAGKHFIYADLLGGNFSFTPSRNDHLVEVPTAMSIDQVYNFNDQEDDSDYEAFYTDCYEVINSANLILKHLPDIDFMDQESLSQIKGEMLVGRAFVHYLLSIFYAQTYSFTSDASHTGIVYNTQTITAGVDYPSRQSLAQTWVLIQSDMEEGISLFNRKSALGYGPDYSWFNENNSKGLYARMALQMNDWQNAYDYANQVISSSPVSLMGTQEFVGEWKKEEEAVSEVLLEFSAPRTSDEGTVSSSVGGNYFNYVDAGNYQELVASGDLLGLYEAKDLRRALFRVEALKTSINNVDQQIDYNFTWKFQGGPGTLVLRLTELYLIRAEALMRLRTQPDQALSDLNTIRSRSGLDPLEDSSDLLEEIFLERRRELAFEGHLFFDIARYQRDVIRNLDCLSQTCNLSYPSDFYVLPIPERSVALNENLKQNEGY